MGDLSIITVLLAIPWEIVVLCCMVFLVLSKLIPKHVTITRIIWLLIGAVFSIWFSSAIFPSVKFRLEAERINYVIEKIAVHLNEVDSERDGHPVSVAKAIEDIKITLDEYQIPYPEFSKNNNYNSWLCFLVQIRNLAREARLEEARRLGKCSVIDQKIKDIEKRKMPSLVPRIVM